MSTIISNATGNGSYDRRLHIKGASEMILECCSKYVDETGNVANLDDNTREKVKEIIKKYAENALRTIALAYRDLEQGQHGEKHDEPNEAEIKDVEKSDLVLIGILGIYDVIRSEVPGAVETCQKAGVTVRMITGDNIVTAQAIAEKCGIITKSEIGDPQVCM